MPFDPVYHESSLSREEIEAMAGPVLLEFGANWCGICAGFSPELAELLREFPQVQHVRVADGKGKPLGRGFKVKLWPTLVFLRDGQVVDQLARPTAAEARAGLETITAASN
ncbi:MAG: thioredoxin family protein [Planctomycetales bacterium]|nr:thioredoxin family protein [Planctomycetales bacterium]MCA9228319.1 thioredoxin family protein [Planctomycetales bacterium]